MPQDWKSSPSRLYVRLRSYSFIGHATDKEVYFLQQSRTRLVEMTESERDKWNANCFRENLDTNNLHSNLLKQHWAPFCNFSSPILYHVGHYFISRKYRKNVKIHMTRHLLEFVNHWLEVIGQFLWLDPDSTRPSHDSILTRREKILDDFDSMGLWLWFDKIDSGTSLPLQLVMMNFSKTLIVNWLHVPYF